MIISNQDYSKESRPFFESNFIFPWWKSKNESEAASKMVEEAIIGKRRSFHVIISTNRELNIKSVFDSLILSTGDSKLLFAKDKNGNSIIKLTYLVFGKKRSKISTKLKNYFSKKNKFNLDIEIIKINHKKTNSSICSSRLIVQNYIKRFSKNGNSLDDDLCFKSLHPGKNGVFEDFAWSWFHEIWKFYETNQEVEIALGDVIGAPPLPASSSLLTTLKDIFAMINLEKTSQPNWSEIDYYYDLSEERTNFDPWKIDESIFSLEKNKLLYQILVNGSLTRPLVAIKKSTNIIQKNRYIRGGNTIYFSTKWIKLIEHPEIPRRGDTAWSLVAKKFGAKISLFPFPLFHLRENIDNTFDWEKIGEKWIKRMLEDLSGASIQRWMLSESDCKNKAIEIFQKRVTAQKKILKESQKLIERNLLNKSNFFEIFTILKNLINKSLKSLENFINEKEHFLSLIENVELVIQKVNTKMEVEI